jgi:uncharacterized phosphosugar-binding protein
LIFNNKSVTSFPYKRQNGSRKILLSVTGVESQNVSFISAFSGKNVKISDS